MASSEHITCIIPAFNAERYLAATLSSVLAQTLPAGEVIVVDDGSRDTTAAVAAGFGAAVRVVRQSNAGPASARNHGVQVSSGELVAFIDADDLWEPEKLALQADRLQQDPDLGYCVCMLRNFVSEDLEGASVRDERLLRPMAGFSLSALMVRRSVLDQVGAFDANRKHSDDTEWFLRASEHGVAHAVLPETLVRRRLHVSNLSQQSGHDSRQEYLHLIKSMLDRRRTRGSAPDRS